LFPPPPAAPPLPLHGAGPASPRRRDRLRRRVRAPLLAAPEPLRLDPERPQPPCDAAAQRPLRAAAPPPPRRASRTLRRRDPPAPVALARAALPARPRRLPRRDLAEERRHDPPRRHPPRLSAQRSTTDPPRPERAARPPG